LLSNHDPSLRCSNCWKLFKEESALNSHGAESRCIKRSPHTQHWMVKEQKQAVKMKMSGDEVEKWYHLFGLLFPDLPKDGPQGFRAKFSPCKSCQSLDCGFLIWFQGYKTSREVRTRPNLFAPQSSPMSLTSSSLALTQTPSHTDLSSTAGQFDQFLTDQRLVHFISHKFVRLHDNSAGVHLCSL